MRTVGKVQIDDTKYLGSDLYSDGPIEDEMLEIAKEYSESEYDGLIMKKKSWPILYHFSKIRENIVNSVSITKGDKVLEIGAGCGAITGALASMAKQVDAIDLSMKRSLINAYRHRDADNITLHVGNFQDIEKQLDTDYDVITLIGVFEYAKAYISDEQPYIRFLNIVKQHLKKGGRLLIAIENKYGLKYWAGCREDHTTRYFESIEGYKEDSVARTFGRRELEGILKQGGFPNCKFFYPYPDYKLPEKIFSDEYLPKVGELCKNHRNFDNDRVELFDESKAFDGLIEEGLFEEFSNSFLVVASCDETLKLDDCVNCTLNMELSDYIDAFFDDFGNGIHSFDELIAKKNVSDLLYRLQIYYDYGQGLSEDNSRFVTVSPDENGVCTLELTLDKNIRMIRIDPAQVRCIFQCIDATAFDAKNDEYKLQIVTNGNLIDKDMFRIDSEDPQIHLQNWQPGTKKIYLQYRITSNDL